MRAALQLALEALSDITSHVNLKRFWRDADGKRFDEIADEAITAIKQALAQPEVSPEQPHTDHPLRHYDQTCPACIKGEA